MHEKDKQFQSLLVNFHVNLLLELLERDIENTEAVELLREIIAFVKAGAKIEHLQWHLNQVREMFSNDKETSEAVDLLMECITNIDSLPLEENE